MRPNSEEVLRGAQQALLTYVLPELQSDYARTELMAIIALLGIVGGEQDGSAQRLVDDNASFRALARRTGDALQMHAAKLAAELRALSAEQDTSVRIADLRAANNRVREAIARAGVWLEGRGEPALRELRAAIIDHLRRDAESRAYPLMGPRADG